MDALVKITGLNGEVIFLIIWLVSTAYLSLGIELGYNRGASLSNIIKQIKDGQGISLFKLLIVLVFLVPLLLLEIGYVVLKALKFIISVAVSIFKILGIVVFLASLFLLTIGYGVLKAIKFMVRIVVNYG